MSLGNKLNAKSHLEVIRHSGGKVFGNLMDFIITFSYWCPLSDDRWHRFYLCPTI